MLAGTLLLSGITNVSLLSDMSKMQKKTDETIETLNRAHLIATYYILNQDPTNQIKKFKEETQMKKFNIGSNLSNRTKVIGSMTILLGIGTIISGIKDTKEIKALESAADMVNDAVDGIRETVEEVGSDIEVTDF